MALKAAWARAPAVGDASYRTVQGMSPPALSATARSSPRRRRRHFPSRQARPLASNLNFVPGQTIGNLVVVPVGEAGRVSFFNAAGQSHVVADVSGWYGA